MNNDVIASDSTPESFQPGRLTIGMLTSSPVPIIGQQWLGAADMAWQRDVNLLCFVGGHLHPLHQPESQANIVYDLANSPCLDGLIVVSVDIGTYVGQEYIAAFCRRYHPLSVINIGLPIEGIPSIFLDNYQGMRQVMTHLIEEHGYRRIAFLRGPEHHMGARERYRAYVETLAAYGIPFEPKLVSEPVTNWHEPLTSRIEALQDGNLADIDALVGASESR